MEEDWQSGLLDEGPEGIEAHMAGTVAGGAARGDHQAPASQLDRLPGDPGCRLDVDQGYIAGRQEPTVNRAEVDHHAVVGPGAFQGQVHATRLLKPVIAQGVGGEDQLAGEAQQVEGVGPVLTPEGTESLVVLAQQQVGFVAGPELGIVVLGASLVRPARQVIGLADRLREGRPESGVDITVDLSRKFHDMRVRVVDRETFHIGHGRPPSSVV